MIAEKNMSGDVGTIVHYNPTGKGTHSLVDCTLRTDLTKDILKGRVQFPFPKTSINRWLTPPQMTSPVLNWYRGCLQAFPTLKVLMKLSPHSRFWWIKQNHQVASETHANACEWLVAPYPSDFAAVWLYVWSEMVGFLCSLYESRTDC